MTVTHTQARLFDTHLIIRFHEKIHPVHRVSAANCIFPQLNSQPADPTKTTIIWLNSWWTNRNVRLCCFSELWDYAVGALVMHWVIPKRKILIIQYTVKRSADHHRTWGKYLTVFSTDLHSAWFSCENVDVILICRLNIDRWNSRKKEIIQWTDLDIIQCWHSWLTVLKILLLYWQVVESYGYKKDQKLSLSFLCFFVCPNKCIAILLMTLKTLLIAQVFFKTLYKCSHFMQRPAPKYLSATSLRSVCVWSERNLKLKHIKTKPENRPPNANNSYYASMFLRIKPWHLEMAACLRACVK